jgi:hypothetical protein
MKQKKKKTGGQVETLEGCLSSAHGKQNTGQYNGMNKALCKFDGTQISRTVLPDKGTVHFRSDVAEP